MEGFGVYTWPSGFTRKYKGGFSKGIKTGKGILILTDGRKYDANFKNNKMHGHAQKLCLVDAPYKVNPKP